MKEERFPHTRKPLPRLRGGGGRSFRATEESAATGQSGETPAQRIGADQHSPAQEACLLNGRDGPGLGAEASVGSQGEDWGWLCEHSLKGLVRHG